MVIFKRKLYQKMLDWKKEFDGRTALLIKGARRVGKSTADAAAGKAGSEASGEGPPV
jgi:predicted AAA+ superfamily ATPase